MGALWKLAREHELRVIEDAAHATGSSYKGIPIGGCDAASGACSDAVAFSFYATKNLTTGEGGMVTCFDEELYDRMRILCLHGMTKDAWNRNAAEGDWFYQVVDCGFKYNLSDIHAALGIHQLRKIDHFIAARTKLAKLYADALSELPEIELPREVPGRGHSWHLYTIRLRLEALNVDRAEFMRRLRKHNIQASVHFIPIPLHPFFEPWQRRNRGHCPRALALYPRLVSLPLYPAMTEEQVYCVSAAVRKIVSDCRRARTVAAALT
jgi:dTDP-4-amino-4,6-dideoxygalactose transaminase